MIGYPFVSRLWPLFSNISGKAAFAIVKVLVPAAELGVEEGLPLVLMPNFRAQIAAPCSGIEGMSLFLVLFTIFINILNSRKKIF